MKKRNRLLCSVLCAAAVSTLLWGCKSETVPTTTGASTETPGSTASAEISQEATQKEEVIRITYVNSGQRGDNGSADSAWPYIEKLNQDYNGRVEAKMIEMAQDTSKFESAILETLDGGCDIIICGSGYSMADTANKYAADYPDTTFYFIDLGTSYEFVSSENTVGMAYKQNEGMFLTGALAGLMSKTGNIGFIGGIENIIINDFGTGYIAGATHVNPNIKIQFSYVGNFNDSAKAKELAGIQANLGADVIHNVAGIAGLGVLEGAQKAGIMALGVDNDQSKGFEETNPELSKVIMTSMVKDWGQVIYNFAVRYIENPDSITYGEIERLGLKEGAVRLAKNEVYEETVPADIREKIDTLEKDIIDEKLQIPSAFDHTDAEWQELKASVALQ